MPRCKAPEILCRERFKTVPYRCTPQQTCPTLDTTKDEGNAADGRFSAACLVKKPFRRIAFIKDLPITKVNMLMDDQV